MTVGDFFVHTTGARQFSFSEDAPSMCGQDIGTGDGVICLITLKKN